MRITMKMFKLLVATVGFIVVLLMWVIYREVGG